ncbi:type II secretion system F family protein [Kribbella qitaiheensis]|uniref:Type II secretion system F family protein n=2 Tax=Kribbella qitaiheensis TaxID=1544730 RepID=A0A7G6XA41_9ACTN|nr:type II secretion system F family protein [Kribbella qitaiheensis]
MPGRPGPRRLGRRRGRIASQLAFPASSSRHRRVAGLAAIGALLLFGFPLGLLIAPAIAFAIPIALSRLEPAAERKRRARIAADIPLAVDLLAACLRAGRPPQAAVGTVAKAIRGPLADLLAGVGHRLALGTDPIEAWSTLLAEPACAGLARAVQRALRSGAPLAKSLEHLADDSRQARRWAVEEQARAVESRAVVPLGLCFLPAFVLLGVVPTVVGSLSGILHLFR